MNPETFPVLRPAQVNTQSLGRLKISLTISGELMPIPGATVKVASTGNPDQVIEELRTDESGQTETIELPAPNVDYSLEPESAQPYSEYTITASAPGYEDFVVSGSQLLSGQTSLQNMALNPLSAPSDNLDIAIPPHTLYYEYPPKIAESEIKPVNESGEIVLSRVVVPETIVVHGGPPMTAMPRTIMFLIKNILKMWPPAKYMRPGPKVPSPPMSWPLCPLP